MPSRPHPPRIGHVALGGVPRVVLCVTDRRRGRLPGGPRPDLLEARIDLFADQRPAAVATALRRLRQTRLPVIGTIRSAAEGGRWQASENDRLALFEHVLPLVDAVDVELASGRLARRIARVAHARHRRVIVSSHDFTATPTAAMLGRRIRAARALGADIVKLAAYANGPRDVATLLSVLLAGGRSHVPLVVLAMGPAGTLSRVFFGAAGSLLTYAFAPGDGATAPGQLSLRELQTELARYYPAAAGRPGSRSAGKGRPAPRSRPSGTRRRSRRRPRG